MRKSLGADFVAGSLDVEAHGLRVHLVHGHLLRAGRRWKAWMESRAFQDAFRRIPSPMAHGLDWLLERNNERDRAEADRRHLAALPRVCLRARRDGRHRGPGPRAYPRRRRHGSTSDDRPRGLASPVELPADRRLGRDVDRPARPRARRVGSRRPRTRHSARGLDASGRFRNPDAARHPREIIRVLVHAPREPVARGARAVPVARARRPAPGAGTGPRHRRVAHVLESAFMCSLNSFFSHSAGGLVQDARQEGPHPSEILGGGVRREVALRRIEQGEGLIQGRRRSPRRSMSM